MRPVEDLLGAPLEGTSLVEASAGTGKTHTVATLYANLVAERGYRVEEILVVTFTEAAAAELRGRIRERLRGMADREAGEEAPRDRLRRAIAEMDRAAVFTIHGFCHRAIADLAFETGAHFDAELVTDQGPLYDEIVGDLWARAVYDAPDRLVRYAAARAEFSHKSLRALVREAVSRADAEILRDPDPPEGDAPFEALEGARGSALGILESSRDEVLEILVKSNSIKHSIYNRRNVPAWIRKTEDQLRQESPIALFDKKGKPEPGIARLTSSAVRGETKAGHDPPEHPLFGACDALVAASEALGGWLSRWISRLGADIAERAREEIARRKEERRILFFDDLLRVVDRALAGDRGDDLARAIRSRHRIAVVDEFQDTDRVQYRIFRRIWGSPRAPLVVIGDPKQSIYRFRGADIHSYLDAARDAKERVYTLDTNWRSDASLVRAVGHLFGRAADPFATDGIGFREPRPREGAGDRIAIRGRSPAALQIRFVDREGRLSRETSLTKGWANEALPRLVAADIARLVADPDCEARPGDVAVLTQTNAQARAVQDALRDIGIPGILWGEGSVLASGEAADLSTLLRAIDDPSRPGAVRAALIGGILGLEGDDLWRLGEDEAAWETWAARLARWRDLWRGRGFARAFGEVLDCVPEPGGLPVRARLLSRAGGERGIANLLHLAEILNARESRGDLGAPGLLGWLDRQRAAAGIDGASVPEEAELRPESDGDAVRISTVHKAKGLQFPVVYCPFLWEVKERTGNAGHVLFHDPEDGHRPKIDFVTMRMDEHAEIAEAERSAEAMRLAYVALTRAEHLCRVVWGAFNKAEGSPLARLLHPSRSSGDLAAMGDGEMRADLDALAAASEGTVSVSDLDEGPAPGPEAGPSRAASLSCRRHSRGVPAPLVTTSFSRLVGGESSRSAEEGLDRDATGGMDRPTPGPGEAGGRRVTLADLEPGARAGNCFHEIFETIDFEGGSGEIRAEVERRLARHGFDPRAWTEPATRAVADALATEIDPASPGLSLSRVPASRRLTEIDLLVPAAIDRGRAVAPGALAAAFAALGHVPDGYAESVSRLGFAPFRGFVKGFADLVFVHGDRWYLVDYKTNHLGDLLDDYRPEALERAMAEHHYYLQYHLYALALHRYLGRRLAGYDYGTHFGGAIYLFLRGMCPEEEDRYGVFRDLPDPDLIEGMSALLDGDARGVTP